MEVQCTEGTAPEASPLRSQAEFNFLKGRYSSLILINRMILPGKRQPVHIIKLCFRQGCGRRILHQKFFPMGLNQRASRMIILFPVLEHKSPGVFPFAVPYLFVAGYRLSPECCQALRLYRQSRLHRLYILFPYPIQELPPLVLQASPIPYIRRSALLSKSIDLLT